VSATRDAGLEAFGLRVREALAAPEGSPLATLFTAPLVTALVVDGEEVSSGDRPERALLETRDALERVGVPRGRQFVLVGSRAPRLSPLDPQRVAQLRGRLSLPVLVHDPAGASFTAGRLESGEPIELDDELREAEAIACVGEWSTSAGGARGGPYLLVPGVASLATRRAWAARRALEGERGALALALAAEREAVVDLALCWSADGRVRAGRGRTQFDAVVTEAGLSLGQA
jgi:hypothetical protein